MAEAAMTDAKVKRRTAKATLTRNSKTLHKKLKENRPGEEITEAFQSVKEAYDDLIVKHEKYAQLIEDDEAFEQEEKWLEECQDTYLQMEITARDYVKSVMANGKPEVESGSKAPLTNNTESPPSETGETGGDVTPANGSQTLSTGEENSSAQAASHNITVSGMDGNNGQNNSNQGNSGSTPCGFRMEKPKMPRFTGDVRDYAIFRSDFKDAIDSRFSKRDAISLLHTSLQGRPLELIKGIGTDYDAAWEYLNSVYGDPRFVADTVTQDISRFRPLHEGEDARFCDLVHLVQRSFSTLKEVGRPHDMDNNHMLALIEQRMCTDDRKVWARHLENNGKEATLTNLIAWMTTEMKSRMRATAPLRSLNQSGRHPIPISSEVNSVTATGLPPKCWMCQNSTHWIDQCRKFMLLSPEDRIKAVRENHGCFSCLK